MASTKAIKTAASKLEEREVWTSSEVAGLFTIHTSTLVKWLPESYRTVGGHRRYRRADVFAFCRAHIQIGRPILQRFKEPETLTDPLVEIEALIETPSVGHLLEEKT